MGIHVEAVIVSLNYDDFLEATIRVNLPHFDEVVVVTSKEDKGTLAVCERYGLRPVLNPYFQSKGSPFNKALAINLGLAHLSCRDWLLHIDADIALPRDTRRVLCDLPLDPQSIYGIDRVDCQMGDQWHRHLVEADPYDKGYFIKTPRGMGTIGHRLSHFDYGQWTPIGFFQLWNAASGIIRYPTVQNASAEHTDVLHSLQWPRERRHLIPELVGVHLLHGEHKMGQNWRGRTSPKYEPGKAAAAAPAVAHRHPHRPHHPHPHPHPHPEPPPCPHPHPHPLPS